MARFSGMIGFGFTEDDGYGVFKERIVERRYFGDVERNYKQPDTGEQLNDGVRLNNTVSVVMDPFAHQNMWAIRYVVWNGVKWKVTGAEDFYPRLKLSLGGVYHAGDR